MKTGNINQIHNETKTKIESIEQKQNDILTNCVQKNEIYDYINDFTRNLSLNEMKQIEEWTNKKCGEVIFDSNTDDWSVNTSVFDYRIMNKSNLMFVIEDDKNNKFGGYITSQIKCQTWITDSNAFVFSLKSNGRLNGMMKFNITEPQYAFYLYQKSYFYDLFLIGGGNDIGIYKKNNFNGGWGDQRSFNYEGHQDVLKGSGFFTIKRFVVIQMK